MDFAEHFVEFFLDEAPEFDWNDVEACIADQDLIFPTGLDRYMPNYWVNVYEFRHHGNPKEITCYPFELLEWDQFFHTSFPINEHGILTTLRRYGGIAHVYMDGKVAATYTADFTRQSVACTYMHKME